MSTLLRASILISCVAVAAVTPACQTPPVTPAASSGEAMPQDVRSRIKEARFQAAIKGLDFEGDLVVVVQPLGGDRDLARQHQAAGLEALQGNRLTGAITELAQAVRTAPQDAALHNSLGVALRAKGKSRYAAAAFRTAVSLDPGLVEAQYNLAMAYLSGEGVKRDDQAALSWLRRAADLGDTDAQFNLGLLYLSGEIVPKDAEEALSWFRFAATSNEPWNRVWTTIR
ncbi:MAG: sel1 repeat family protein [Planctomycetes bacterium]|nr:sel1 repeat family protein [Planctomycetota bacterium]